MPPEMITNVAPMAMMAKKLVSFAICVRLRALKNLFFSTNTRSESPDAVRRNSACRTEPPKIESSKPISIITKTRPASCKRNNRAACVRRERKGPMQLGFREAAGIHVPLLDVASDFFGPALLGGGHKDLAAGLARAIQQRQQCRPS